MYYPIMMTIEGRSCLVVGGGTVAARKIKELAKCGAKVKVVSPVLCGELQLMLNEGPMEWVQDHYDSRYLSGVLLCFACTDNAGVNRKIAEDAKERSILVNVAYGGEKETFSTFITPSVRRKGDITLAVSCEENPAASRYMAAFLENCVQGWQSDYIKLAKEIRSHCRHYFEVPLERQEFMKHLFDTDMLALAEKSPEEAKAEALRRLEMLCLGRSKNNDEIG